MAVEHTAPPNLIVDFTPACPIDSVQPHPENYRKGSLPDIIDSLKKGQYRAIVVNRRNHYICAGNNTWRGAKALGWPTIAVEWVDVDRTRELEILAADNKLNELGENDPAALAAVLAELAEQQSLLGTGYTPEEVADLLDTVSPPSYVDTPSYADYASLDDSSAPVGARKQAVDIDGDGETEVITDRGTVSQVGHLKETIVMVRQEDYDTYMANIERLKQAYGLQGYAVVVIEAVRREAERHP